MINRKCIAIWDEHWQHYKWFSVAQAQINFEENHDTTWPGVTLTRYYQATGRFVTRADGEQAEIFECE